MAPGIQSFTFFQMGKESAAGTPVAATRQFYPDGTGVLEIDDMLALHRGNRGTVTRLAYASTKGVAVNLNYKSDPDLGVAYDELPWFLNQLVAAGGTATGGSADKTWTHAPPQTAAAARDAFTIEVGDDTQAFEVEYCQLRDFTISAAMDGMTQMEANWFGRQPSKVSKTSLSANTAVRIPGYLWKPTFATAQSGLAGGTASSNLLVDFSLNVQTGLVPRFYQDGLAYFGQAVLAEEVKGVLTMHVESTSTAVSQFYDKKRAQTVDFLQLQATGPSLGTSNYKSTIQLALLYTDVKPIASESDGVNLYEVSAETVIDATWAQSMSFSTVCSIATI